MGSVFSVQSDRFGAVSMLTCGLGVDSVLSVQVRCGLVVDFVFSVQSDRFGAISV